MNKLLPLSLLAFLLFTSCNIMNCPDKNTFITSYTSFVDNVEAKNKEGNQNWSEVDLKFEDYVDRCYPAFKDKFDNDDLKVFWSKTIKYYYNRYNGDLSKAFNNAEKRFSKEFEEDMKIMLKDVDNDVLSLFKDIFKDDLKKGVDNVLEILNDLGDDIKKDLENSK